MQTDWHCRWLKADQVYHTRFRCRLYRLEFLTGRRPLSLQLDASHCNQDSSLSILSAIYARHGHIRKIDPIDEDLGPRVELPLIHLHTHYDLMAINGSDLERSVRNQLDPTFSLAHLVQQFCQQYNCHWARTFPSLSHDVTTRVRSNGDVSNDAAIYRIDTDENLYRNLPTLTKESVKKRVNITIEWEEGYDVLIPLALLPLVLDLMPGYFQQVNNIGQQCMRMRETLLMESTLGLYPRYVQEQLELVRHNCHALGFLAQQARFQLQHSQTEQVEDSDDEINELHQKEVSQLLLQIERMHQHMALLNEKLAQHNGS